MRYIQKENKNIKHSMEIFNRIVVNNKDFYTVNEDLDTIIKIDATNDFILIGWPDNILYWEEFLEEVGEYSDDEEYSISKAFRYNEEIEITVERK